MVLLLPWWNQPTVFGSWKVIIHYNSEFKLGHLNRDRNKSANNANISLSNSLIYQKIPAEFFHEGAKV